MRRVSVRLERMGRESKLRIWGVPKGNDERLVIAAVQNAGGRIDLERVRGGDGEIIVSSYPNLGSLQQKIVNAIREALPHMSVRGKTKNFGARAT